MQNVDRTAEIQKLHEQDARVVSLKDGVVKVQNRIVESQIKKKRAEAAMSQVADIGPETKVYSQVSRVFLLRPHGALRAEMCSVIKEMDEEIPKLSKLEKDLMASLSKSQQELFQMESQFVSSFKVGEPVA